MTDYISEALQEALDKLEPEQDYWVSEIERRRDLLQEAVAELQRCERQKEAIEQELEKRDAERL